MATDAGLSNVDADGDATAAQIAALPAAAFRRCLHGELHLHSFEVPVVLAALRASPSGQAFRISLAASHQTGLAALSAASERLDGELEQRQQLPPPQQQQQQQQRQRQHQPMVPRPGLGYRLKPKPLRCRKVPKGWFFEVQMHRGPGTSAQYGRTKVKKDGPNAGAMAACAVAARRRMAKLSPLKVKGSVHHIGAPLTCSQPVQPEEVPLAAGLAHEAATLAPNSDVGASPCPAALAATATPSIQSFPPPAQGHSLESMEAQVNSQPNPPGADVTGGSSYGMPPRSPGGGRRLARQRSAPDAQDNDDEIQQELLELRSANERMGRDLEVLRRQKTGRKREQPKPRALTERERANLQEKIDCLDELQLDRVVRMLHQELGVTANCDQEEAHIDIQSLSYDQQRRFLHFVDVEFKNRRKRRTG